MAESTTKPRLRTGERVCYAIVLTAGVALLVGGIIRPEWTTAVMGGVCLVLAIPKLWSSRAPTP